MTLGRCFSKPVFDCMSIRFRKGWDRFSQHLHEPINFFRESRIANIFAIGLALYRAIRIHEQLTLRVEDYKERDACILPPKVRDKLLAARTVQLGMLAVLFFDAEGSRDKIFFKDWPDLRVLHKLFHLMAGRAPRSSE